MGIRFHEHPLHVGRGHVAMTWRVDDSGWFYWSRYDASWKRGSGPSAAYGDCLVSTHYATLGAIVTEGMESPV